MHVNLSNRFLAAASMAALLTLAGCGGGGGGGGSTSTTVTSSTQPALVATALDKPNLFLLFPNPQVQSDGSYQTDTADYTDAYYRAIDPNNQRTTLAGFEAVNGFGSGTGTEFMIIFGDTQDLGYGRRMTVRKNTDGTMAFFVYNFQVTSALAYGFTPANLDAAISNDTRWLLGINAIEFSPGPNGGVPFAKFYNFNPEGNRNTFAILDDRGGKAMPGPCITCHGGRGDAMTPPAGDGLPLFNLVQNSASQARGDVQAHLQSISLDQIEFSTTPGYTRADQEANFKLMAEMVLCSYPLPYGTTSSAPEDQCRRPANHDEWQGTAAELIKFEYGGDGLPSATAAPSLSYVPSGWVTAGYTTLYQTSVAPSCRTCHLLRGTNNQSDLDFNDYGKFSGYLDRVKPHTIDRGNMPDDELVYDHFWGGASSATLANYLQSQGYTTKSETGAVLMPGRPIADPGPDRTWTGGQIPLSARLSLYASSYSWSIVSGPPGATLNDSTSETPTLTTVNDGTYVIELVAKNGTLTSAPADLTIVVNSALTPVPSAIRFADIKSIIQGTCVECHKPGGGPLATPPVFWADYDRNGDGKIDGTDEQWLYAEVMSRVNMTDVIASPILRKPSNHHHFGGLQSGFDNSKTPGDPARVNYDIVLNWVLSGAPY